MGAKSLDVRLSDCTLEQVRARTPSTRAEQRRFRRDHRPWGVRLDGDTLDVRRYSVSHGRSVEAGWHAVLRLEQGPSAVYASGTLRSSRAGYLVPGVQLGAGLFLVVLGIFGLVDDGRGGFAVIVGLGAVLLLVGLLTLLIAGASSSADRQTAAFLRELYE